MAKPTCNWWLDSDTRCGKPVRYRLVRDDDGNPVRKYDNLCSEHQEKQKEIQSNDKDIDWE